MKMFQVTDHATGEVENIEAESASIAGLAFQLEGRSVTIIPINPINNNPEVIMKDHEITKNNPKEEVKMEWKDKYLDIGYMSGRYRARRQAYNEKERYTKMWQRKEHLYVSQCKLCKSFTAWNKVTRQIHLLTKDQYGYWYNEKDMHVYGKCVEVVTQAVINPPQNVNASELAVKQTTTNNPEEGNNMDTNLITTTTNPKEGNKMATKPTYHIAFTGHRPDKIGGYDETSPKRFALRQEIQATLQRAVDKYSTTHQIIVISGGALGVDQDAARIAYQMNIPFIVAQPCKNHESKWFKESQIKYAKMLELAHEVVLVSDGTYDELGAKCMQDRNIWMVDHCDALIAVWDGTSGGTANCVKYALKVNKPIVYINPNNFGGEGGEPTSTPINPKEGPNMNVNPEPITKEVIIMDTKPVNKTTNPEEGTTMNKQTVPPAGALVKLEKLSPQETEWIINKLEENILPHLVADVSNYAKGRMRTWLPYEAPLDSPNSANRPFLPALLDDEVWQWIVDLCAKHGFKAETALISKGGNIKPHRDTTYAAAWAVGINLGSCNWHIASSRDMSTPDYTMDLDGGEIFKFNSKHTHAVTNADTDRWGINVWAIADTNAAQNADVRGRLETMLVDHPEVAEFIDYHQPGASKPIIKEVNTMESNATEAEWENNPNALGWMAVQTAWAKILGTDFEDELVVDILPNLDNTVIVYHDEDLFWQCSVEEYKQMYTAGIRFAVCEKMGEMYRLVEMYRVADNEPGFMLTKFQWDSLPQLIKDYHDENKEENPEIVTTTTKEVIKMDTKPVNTTNNPIKEGTNMIKEYLVHTPSLIDSSTIDKEMVHSRIITNDPEYAFGDGKSVVIEETKPGGYHWFFLEHMFGNQSFAVNITAYAEPILGEQQLGALAGDKKPEDVIFGWADFDAEYMIRVKGYKGTKFSDLSEYGLSVGNSAKMTKRLTEIIRASRGGMVNVKGKHKMARILVLTHYDILDILPHLETEEIGSKTFDGISLITNDYAKKVYRANKHLSGKAKYSTLQDMDDRKVTNHTLRVVTSINGKSGMIKGNVLSVSKEALLARLREFGMISSTQVVDIVTTVDNFKEELGTDGSWEIITLEPHHGPGMVKTNDQTLAQFWNIEGIFDPKTLLTEFKSVLDNSYNNLVEGKDIQWMQNIVAERVTNEAGKFAAITGGKVTNNMNKMIASLNELGLDIGVSQTLMFMRAQGIKKMFLSETKKEGFNWQANAREKKSFVFMPYAYRAYVMTKEVLWLAGYDIDLGNDESFYHEDTQTFCMSGKTWANVQGKLGGADLDDEIMIHERRYVRPDGTVNPLVAFLVRTPNDWAEFAILNLAEPGPAFLTDGDMPTIHAEDLAKFKQTSVAGKLPSATIGSDRPASAVWDWESSVYNYNASMYKNGGVGGQVKTKMLQYGINNAPFRNLPCANEDMIDALQQCKGTTADLEALVEWSVEATKQVLQSQSMDAYWWYSRNMFKTAKALKKNHGLTWWNKPLSDKQSPIVQEFMIPREEMVRETHQEMINFLNRNIMEIPELENIFDDKKQEMHYRKLINDLSKLFIVPKVRDEHGNVLSASKHEITRHMQAVAIGLLERMANYQFRAGSEQTNLHVLRMVRASYLVKQNNPGANYDRWLYTAANDSEVIMTDYFVRALIAFRG